MSQLIQSIARRISAVYAALAASSGAGLVGFIAAGAGAVLRTLQAKLRDKIDVRDFGAVLDGVADDTAAVQAAFTAANGTGKCVTFSGAACKITATLSQNNHAHYDVDWGGCKVTFTGGAAAYLLDMTQAGRIKHRGGVFTGSGANHYVTPRGRATAQATAYPTIPAETEWARQIWFENQTVTGFVTVLDMQNFTREVWIRSCYITGNTTAVKATGKVVNVFGSKAVLYSGVAASQAVVVRGDATDAAYRYAEGLMSVSYTHLRAHET